MTPTAPTKIRPKERTQVLNALRAGVVPHVGQHLIQVGRQQELAALDRELDSTSDGGSSVRFIIGDYGSGKTFFLNRVRSLALEKRIVTAHDDLTPELRLSGSDGQARKLFSQLMRSLATPARPEGGAISAIVELWVTSALKEAGNTDKRSSTIIEDRLDKLTTAANSFVFAEVVNKYYLAYERMDELTKASAIQWLRGEFPSKTEARKTLDVKGTIDDDNWYDHLKLMAQFVRQAGFGGMVVCLDEMATLCRISNTQSRNLNYDRIHAILNNALQGAGTGLSFVLGGTTEFLNDTHRGIYSHEALRRKLESPSLTKSIDWNAPVLQLQSLTRDDLFQLIANIRHVHASGDPAKYALPDEGLERFMEKCEARLGEASFRSPRNTVKSFAHLLGVLESNPQTGWRAELDGVQIEAESSFDELPLPAAPPIATSATAGGAF